MIPGPEWFVAACALFTAGLLWAEKRESVRLKWLFKPLASASFVGVAIAGGALSSRYGQVILVGVVLCMLGDLLLIPRKDSTFLLGLGSFLLGHVAFAWAFTMFGLDMTLAAAGLALAAVLAIPLMGFLIWPRVPAPMRVPVALYTLVISAMVATACGGWGQGLPGLVPVGALAFFLSDLSVALDRFVRASFTNRVWGLPLYFGAVCLIALSASMVWNSELGVA